MESPRDVVVLLVLLVLVGCTGIHAQLVACTFSDTASGKNYDLSALAALYSSSSSPSQTDPTPPGYLYYVSPCRTVQGQQGCTTANIGVCQVSQRGDPFNVGGLAEAVTEALDKGVEGFRVNMQMMADKTSTIDYVCDEKAGTGSLAWTNVPNAQSKPPYLYAFEWRTQYACPIGGGGGGGGAGGASGGEMLSIGWILVISLSGLVVVYLAVGVTVQKFVLHKSGVELIPNSSFWLALPGLVKDGHVLLYTKTMRLLGRGSSYTEV